MEAILGVTPGHAKVVKGGSLDEKKVYTKFQSDFGYARRNSLIPSWNQGVIEVWIIRKECDSKTQRNGVITNPRRLLSSSFEPKDELEMVLRYPKDYQLLIQRPGQLIRHNNGKHIHWVITAIDIEVNPSRMSLSSLGRKDYFPGDNYAFASSTTETLVIDNEAEGTFKLVSREKFIEHQLTTEEKKIVKRRIEAEDKSKRTKKKKRKGGFQEGNSYALKSPN
eukprot:gene35790-46442_t